MFQGLVKQEKPNKNKNYWITIRFLSNSPWETARVRTVFIKKMTRSKTEEARKTPNSIFKKGWGQLSPEQEVSEWLPLAIDWKIKSKCCNMKWDLIKWEVNIVQICKQAIRTFTVVRNAFFEWIQISTESNPIVITEEKWWKKKLFLELKRQ